MLAQAVGVCKHILQDEEAFEEDNIVCTESTMGALAKIAYKHMDGTNVTSADLVGVLSRMPFTADETEAMSSHRILIEEAMNPNSAVHEAGVKASVKEALIRIRDYEGSVTILSQESKQMLVGLPL